MIGIDVSHHQTTSEWQPDGVIQFCIARATIGTQVDQVYDNHIAKARAAGLVTGAYHFNWSGLSISAQVDAFRNRAGNVDLYALDVENDNGSGHPAFSRSAAAEFIRLFKRRTGKKIGLYMSESHFYEDVGQDWNWVAHWDREPRIPWDIWQYGSYKGEDGNRFEGTRAQLLALGGNTGDMGTAINSTTRTIKSTHVRWLKQGTPVFKDTSETPLTTIQQDGWYDDFGRPYNDSSYALVGVRSRNFDADDDVENGQGIVTVDADNPAALRRKTAEELQNTAEAFFATPSDTTPYDQQDIDTAVTAATMALQAAFDAYKAAEATRVAEAIAADRLKARPGVIYET